MRNVVTFPFTILCMVLALNSCSKTNSYAADISDLNGTWQPDRSYKATLEMLEEEKDDYLRQREYSWGIGKMIPYTTFNIDITAEEPFVIEPSVGHLLIKDITQTRNDLIKIILFHVVAEDPIVGWSTEVVFHFINKDTLWIETKNFTGIEYEKKALWHRLSGPAP